MTTRPVQWTLTGEVAVVKCGKCDKLCKNLRGLQIHQAKTDCGKSNTQTQRSGGTPGKTLEDPNQEESHRTRNLYASENLVSNTQGGQQEEDDHDPLLDLLPLLDDDTIEHAEPAPQAQTAPGDDEKRRPQKAWPKTTGRRAWQELDQDVSAILETTLQGPADKKIRAMTGLIYTVSKERYGLTEKKPDKPAHIISRRQRLIKQTRKELKHVKRQYRKSKEEEKVPLGDCSRLEPEDPPETPFDTKEPSLSEVQHVVKKARTGSSPGPNGTPYRVFKMCPGILRKLWSVLRVIWRKGKIPDCWKRAEGIFAPKEKYSTDIGKFRTISLLNVEGKIFFAVLAKRLTTFLKDNNYVDTSIQKGGVLGFSVCVEHTSVLSLLIREARANHDDLTVVWLDLDNAYGSIPHKLIEKSLEQYHVPEHVCNLVKDYYRGIKLRFAVGDQTTAWQSLEKGIVTGCTISVLLFVNGNEPHHQCGEERERDTWSKSSNRNLPTSS
ncbi:uncharacterized protein LOC127865289 [Dreissena polymorpha]|uniref:uncharacterized protein LOC127865289 n=1 Tax=Dreissena polymorpha TaxID=45954 RepID=UPI00226427C8|nr:uncharacterized protein LOC127865289 [Dreissena polymorpha]